MKDYYIFINDYLTTILNYLIIVVFWAWGNDYEEGDIV